MNLVTKHVDIIITITNVQSFSLVGIIIGHFRGVEIAYLTHEAWHTRTWLGIEWEWTSIVFGSAREVGYQLQPMGAKPI